MSSSIKEATNYHLYLYDKIRPFLGNKVWEIGFGYGGYTKLLLQNNKKILASDIDTALLTRAKEEFAEANGSVQFMRVDLNNPSDIEEACTWGPDSIVCFNVLEHIQDDTKCLVRIHDCVRPSTKALFIVPAFQFMFGTMDKEAGHFRRYTRTKLAETFQNGGWKILKSIYINPIGGLGWFIQSRVSRSKSSSLDSPLVNSRIRFFDQYCLGPTKALDPFFSYIFGQSVLLVAEA